MKRLLVFILLTSALAAFFSCAKNEIAAPVQEARELIITATREDDGPATKTELVGSKTYWSVGDKISVFFGSGTNGGAEFTSLNTEPSASADFTGVLTAVTGSEDGSSSMKYFWGVYPYSTDNSVTLSGTSNYLTTVVSDVQYGVADSYSPGQNIWVGKNYGLELSFKSLLSGIRFTFSRDDIAMVTIQGNNGENIAGKVNVTMDGGVPVVSSVVEGKTVLTLKPDGGGTFQSGAVYRALFLPTNFTKGLTVRFYTSTSSIGTRTYGTLNFERNEPKNAANADSNATWEDYFVTGIAPFEYYNYALSTGSTLTLSATVLPEYAWNAEVTWESSDPSVASVSGGVVTGLRAGTTAITATTAEGGYSSECYVTVLSNASTVNMGNGIFMATRNVGADSPEEVGDYFAWGETTPKSTYTWNNYKWGTRTALRKYNTNDRLGTKDNLTTLQADDDAATVNLGPNWRMPTKDEVDWLKEHCDMIEANMNGQNGYILRSGVTDNAVFFPMSGEMSESGLALEEEYSFFWTSTLGPNSYNAILTSVYGLAKSDIERYYGYPVRAVYISNTNSHDYVEMGDGHKWATMDIGANAPWEIGERFAWGETEPRDNARSFLDYEYKFGSSEGSGYTKYNGTDGKSILDPEDDAATANWGGKWRMPTRADWTWLEENCTITHTYDYNGTGVGGLIFISMVPGYLGNQLFFPCDLIGDIYHPDDLNIECIDYWSSELEPANNYDAYYWEYLSSDPYHGFDHLAPGRDALRRIRPVSE